MTRRYEMQARAEAVEARRERILDATYELFTRGDPDEVTLEAVAAAAGVSVKTVMRQFGSKEGLLLACAHAGRQREERHREVEPGNLDAVVEVLSARYDEMLDLAPKMMVLAERFEGGEHMRTEAIASHREWLERVFAPWLVGAGATRKRRVMALYGATEMYMWWMWRRRLGLGRAAAAKVMREMLDALVTHWGKEQGT